MSFLHPLLFAAGAAAIAIPIAVHLLMRRRRKPVPWAAMRFLIEAYKRQRRRLQIEQWLVLALRCLLVLLIAAAIARPAFDRAAFAGGTGGADYYIVIDNALTAQLIGEAASGGSGGIALEGHRAAALDLLAGFGPADRVGLISMARPAAALVVPVSSDLDAVRRLIESLEPSEARADLPGALEAIAPHVVEDRDTIVSVFSGFREGSLDTSAALRPVLAGSERVRIVHTEPASASIVNISLAGAQPMRRVLARTESGEGTPVRVALRRFGEGENALASVRIEPAGGEGVPASATSRHRWSAGEGEARVTVLAPSPDESLPALRLSIDRDALAGDNLRYTAVRTVSALRVGIAGRRAVGATGLGDYRPGRWVRFALAPIESAGIEVRDVDASTLDRPLLAGLDAVVLTRPDLVTDAGWTELAAFAHSGGALMVMPSPTREAARWPATFSERFGFAWQVDAEPIELDESAGSALRFTESALRRDGPLRMLADELPALAARVGVSDAQPATTGEAPDELEVLARLPGGEPLMIWSSAQRGSVVYLGLALSRDWTDLPARPLMVALLQELVRQGVGAASGALEIVAGDTPGELPEGAALSRVLSREATEPAVGRVPVGEPLRRAGLYRIERAEGDGGLVVVNADAAGSSTRINAAESVQASLGGALSTDPSAARGRVSVGDETGSDADAQRRADARWSAWLLIAAGLVALAEAFAARLASHAGRSGGEDG